ncbi:MAG: FAD-dependent oxidoreductase [Deltaproteobacteria bacterium]|nr:FAD-dependent oxidoreductase [Deltaproteobacteria bacterium]
MKVNINWAEAGKRRARVVGAGMTGLCAAAMLGERGWRVEVLEAADGAGGLLRPVPFHGVACDRGSHRVHAEAYAWLRDAAGVRWVSRPRRGMMVLGGRHVPYPLAPWSFARGVGARATVEMAAGFLLRPGMLAAFRRWESARPADGADEGFEAFVRGRAGTRAYEAFYRPYAEKVWGVPPAELSRSVAKQRVSTAAPLRGWTAARRPQSFLYPAGGMAALLDALVRRAAQAGVEVRYGARFTAADVDPRVPTLFTGGLGALTGQVGLEHRGLHLVFLALDTARVSAVDTWYLPGTEWTMGRVSEVGNFGTERRGRARAVLCVEVPQGRGDPARVPHVDDVTAQLRRAGILPARCRVLDHHHVWVDGVYPLHRRGWRRELASALEHAAGLGVLPLGRQGLFLHCNLDHCARMARAAVEHLDGGGDARGWLALVPGFLDARVRD